MSFVHLHVHSHYSLLKAASTIPKLIDKCVELEMPSVALTDYGNMFGALEFYFYAKEKGINPILGSEIYYIEDRFSKVKQSGNFRASTGGAKTLVLLAQNSVGYKNLCQINTLGYQEGFYFVPRVDYEILEKHKEGIIALTGGARGSVPHVYETLGKKDALKEIKKLHKIFGSNFYLEFYPNKLKGYDAFLAEISRKEGISCIIGNDVHYVEKKEFVIQEVLSCIGINRTLNDRDRKKLGPPEFYLKSFEEIKEFFSSNKSIAPLFEEACANTLKISDTCHIDFKVKDDQGRPIYHLPQLSDHKTENLDEELEKLAYAGLENRFKEFEFRKENILEEEKKNYTKRLEYELSTIKEMGFTGYFYIVQDFIRWAKDCGIPVGPGRGSGASSLVSYSLGITDLDPMPLNLIFERFLNPERISMPDFDIDFCQENRGRVIQYINNKYGLDCTSHVITYGRLNVRAAIRDVGRVLGLSYAEVDQIAKMIPNRLDITLKTALKQEPRLKHLADENPQIEQLLKLTGMIEGLIRHVGIHAAGIIIADNPIIEYAPLYKGDKGENVIQYDLKHAEKIGLVKFDFLGLKTLTHIEEALRLIKELKGKTITIKQISLKDEGIYELMSKGDTMGVFQFEGRGITSLLTKSKVNCFEDIVAINALYRPGPMSRIPFYLDRKKGNVPSDYIFPELEPILKETYGVIIYQEQVQQIAVEIAGYSYGEADVLRRAMGKKIHSVMKKQKTRFLSGAAKRKYNLAKAEELFDLLAEFANYGFNKSHAAAYCVLAAQTAWLKYYYPIEFFASQMTIEKSDSDKLAVYIKDALQHNISVLPPDINHSSVNFSIQDEKIYFALSAIKGVGDTAAQSIVDTRNNLPNKKFTSIEDFFQRVDFKKINRRTVENLIKSGAFDHFGIHRKELCEQYDKLHKYSIKMREDMETGQKSLFSLSQDQVKNNSVSFDTSNSWSHQEQAFYEKEAVGFYLIRHPMKFLIGLENTLGLHTLQDLKNISEDKKTVKVAGVMSNMKEIITKRSKKLMSFGELEDTAGSVEIVMFPEVYKKIKDQAMVEGDVIIVTGSAERDEEGVDHKIIVERIQNFDDFLSNINRVKLQLYPDMPEKKINELKGVLERNSQKGGSKLSIYTYMPKKDVFAEINSKNLPSDIRVSYDFLEDMRRILKENSSRITFL